MFIIAAMPAALAHGVTIKPSSPHYGVTNIVPPSETIDFAVTIADDMGYVLKSSGFSTSSSSDAFVWKTNGACIGRQFSFSIVNTEWVEQKAVASVNCVWSKATGDGGGGDGPAWPDIDGSALDMAVAGKGEYRVHAVTNRAPAGASVGVKAELEDGKGGTNAVKSDWTVSGAGKADGQDHDVSEIVVMGTNTGIATAKGTFCMDGIMTNSDTITFVGVASVTCLGVTSTTNDPGTNETVYAQYMGTGQTFTVTAAADPDEPWPEGNPTWIGATPPDSNNPAMATNYCSDPGQYLVRASCGSSSKALKIELTEVLLSMAEYLGIDLTDPTNKVDSGSASAAVTPSGGVTNYSWTLTGVAVFTNGVKATNTAVSSIEVYETRTASAAYRGDSIAVQIAPLGYMAATNFTVVKADIEWPGLAETNEETIGGFVAYNGDDDDTNGVADAAQGAMENGIEDDDLLAITLNLAPAGLPTNETVTISCDGCWLDRQKLTNAAGEYTLTNAGLFPLTVYVEGKTVSQSARDQTITMTHAESGAKDLVKYTVIRVGFNELWETSNRVNQVFNPTPKDDPPPTASNKIYVVESPDSLYHVTLDVNDQPASMRSKLMYAVFMDGSKLSGSDGFFPATGPADITFDHPSLSAAVEKDFELRVGYDLNGNSKLDSTEEMPISVTNTAGTVIGPPIARGTSSPRYPVAMTVVDAAVLDTLTLPHASRLLRIFRDATTTGLPADKAPTATSTISFNCYSDPWAVWLTHNAGAPFNSSGTASIQYYVWGTNTSLADLTCNSYQMKPQVEAFYNSTVLPIANAFFATNPVGTIATFPLDGTSYNIPHTDESPSWVTNYLPGVTVTFDHPYQVNGINDDINGTIGRGRIISHTAKFTFEKKSFLGVEYVDLTRTHVMGVVEDLYDFNRDGGGAGEEAAIIQLGHGNGSYGTGRTSGVIYRNKIEIDQDITF